MINSNKNGTQFVGDTANDVQMSSNFNNIISTVKSELISKYESIDRRAVYFIIIFFPSMISIRPIRFVVVCIIRQAVGLLLTIIGTTLGVGLGLGFSTFVREQLEQAHNSYHTGSDRDREISTTNKTKESTSVRQKQHHSQKLATHGRHPSTASSVEDNSYVALMASAGYALPNGILRGQILRNIDWADANSDGGVSYNFISDIAKRKSIYSFPTVGDKGSHYKGLATFQRMFPNLPKELQSEFGYFLDYIMRDYVTSWYASVDDGLRYEDEVKKRKRFLTEQTVTTEGTGKREVHHDGEDSHQRIDKKKNPSKLPLATMVLSTKPSLTVPFIEILYASLCTIIGNFATYAGDNVNVANVVLVHFLNILKVNIKVYRELRKCVSEKNKKKTISEDVVGSRRESIGRLKSGGMNLMEKIKMESVRGGACGEDHYGCGDIGEGTPEREYLDSNVPTAVYPNPPAINATSGGAVNARKEDNDLTLNDRQEHHNPKPHGRKYKKLEPVSEIAMVREYLLQGKFHRAITFGMDVPGLLFGDIKGKECPPPSHYTDEDDFLCRKEEGDEKRTISKGEETIYEELEEDKILQKRIFGNKQRIIYECEMDYNRLLAHRVCRIIFPRADFNSPVGRSLCVEIFASCILTPIMECFCPDYINSWVLKCLNDENTKDDSITSNNDEGNMKGGGVEVNNRMKETGQVEPVVTTLKSSVMSPETRSPIASSSNYESLERNGGTLSDRDDEEEAIDTEQTGSLIDEISNELNEALDHDPSDTDDGEIEIAQSIPQEDPSSELLPLLTTSLIELQPHVDLGGARIAGENNEGVEGVDWAGKDCCNAVRNLLLIIEAALIHGILEFHQNREAQSKKSISLEISVVNDTGVDNAVEMSTNPPYEISDTSIDDSTVQNASLISLLMEITSDLESFEKKIDEDENQQDDDEDMVGESAECEEDTKKLSSLLRPNTGDLSTFRSLIAAWLHTGSLYRTFSLLVRAKKRFLQPFYHKHAFLNSMNASNFVRQLRVLHEVDILVDTTSVLTSPPLDLYQDTGINVQSEDEDNTEDRAFDIPGFFPATTSDVIKDKDGENLSKSSESILPIVSSQNANKMENILDSTRIVRRDQKRRNRIGVSMKANFENNKKLFSRLVRASSVESALQLSMSSKVSPNRETLPVHSVLSNVAKVTSTAGSNGSQCTPSYLLFHRNEVFATSLRAERDRRMESFARVNTEAMAAYKVSIEMICRSRGNKEKHFAEHRELHNLVKLFYSNTVSLVLQNVKSPRKEDKAELKRIDDTEGLKKINKSVENKKDINVATMTTVLMMESISPRRKMEVPDDDSSFLLRAQPRPLNVIGVHRDQLNHSHSYKKYAAFYDEPVLNPKTKTDRGGRLRKKCCLRFYPSDRTASISFIHDNRKVDHRKCAKNVLLNSDGSTSLPKELHKERYFCNKANYHGAERLGSSLSNTILANTVMDASDLCLMPRTGRAIDFVYRMSLFERPIVELAGKRVVVQDSAALGAHQADASSLEISDAALSAALLMCDNAEAMEPRTNLFDFNIKCSSDGMPVVFMKLNDINKSHPVSLEKSATGVRPYRISFVRAALLTSSCRKEAQLQCLLSYAGSGSTRNVTKSRTDLLLQPTLGLLDFATSEKREKQSILLRDLKLGINHIDREQLRRNGLLNPRFPTLLRQLKVTVESALQSNQNVDLLGLNVLYKLRCIAVTEFIGVNDSDESTIYGGNKPDYGDLFREEWVVMRSFRDFSTLHKFLKTQVSPNEYSGGTGAKIVGAATGLATAAFTIGNNAHAPQTKRKTLIPSLSQASKTGPIGVTKKFIEKRRQVLNNYLRHLLSTSNLLNRCPELLRFLGAYDPFPSEIKPNHGILTGFTDSFGRCDMCKSILKTNISLSAKPQSDVVPYFSIPFKRSENNDKLASIRRNSQPSERLRRKVKKSPKKPHLSPAKLAMLASVKSRVERVKLGQVRSSAFELMRITFDLDNASFFRNQMISALKTASFALTSGQEFNETLINLHLKHLNGKSLSWYVKYARDLIWPKGVIYQSNGDLTRREKLKLKSEAKSVLHKSFPDQLKAVLGHQSTENGLDLLHEMLQNRLVLKSMAYMMIDALLLEIFPEIGDIINNDF